MNNYKRLIIADDLTGANDTGIHFLSLDKSVGVVADSDGAFPGQNEGTLVVNTNTRMLSSKDAYSKVLRTVKQYSEEGVEVFKKIDSTLRGNVGAEIDAMIDGKGFDLVCVAPAAPRNGRTVVSGKCFINGTPLAETEISSDPFTPVKSSDVKYIISCQTNREIDNLMLEQIRTTPQSLNRHILKMMDNDTRIIIADSENVEDLRMVKDAFASIHRKVLFVGAAGLYHAMFDDVYKTLPPAIIKLNDDYRFLFMIGSLMDTTLRQTEWLENRVKAESTILSTSGAINSPESEVKKIVHKIKSDFEKNNIVILKTESESCSENMVIDSGKIGSVAGNSVKRLLEESGIDVFLLSGGDTALHILKQLNINYLQLVDEALPGIPVAIAVHPVSGREILIITKAGSYGEQDAFEKILLYLSNKLRRAGNE